MHLLLLSEGHLHICIIRWMDGWVVDEEWTVEMEVATLIVNNRVGESISIRKVTRQLHDVRILFKHSHDDS